MTTNRGGRRPGAGRHAKPKGEKMERVTISLKPEQIEWLKRSGTSKKIREMLEKEMTGL